MGVSFYAAKRGRKTEEIHHSGYGGYHAIRTYLLACFNVQLAKAFYIFDMARTEPERKMLKDCSPYVPEDALPLFSSSDCEGKWGNDTVKRIAAAVKTAPFYDKPDAIKTMVEAIVADANPPRADDSTYAGFINTLGWRAEAVSFVENLERVGAKGCRVYWC